MLLAVRRAVGGVLLVAAMLAGCAASPEERAHANVQDRLDGVHGGFLERRTHDPTSTGPAAVESLDRYGYSLETTVGPDEITFLRAVGSVVESGGGLSYEQVSVGACVLVTVRFGEGGSDRGSVTTEPVRCPEGVQFDTEKGVHTVDVVTTDLETRSDDVGEPPPDRSVCLSGELCTEGGG